MDDIALIERLGSELAPDTGRESGIARARASLDRRMAVEPAAPGSRRRRALAVAVTLGVAATVATVAVAVPRPAVRSEAAAALDRAALAVTAATPAPPGRYLEVITTETSVGYVENDAGEVAYAYEAPSVTRTWIPADRGATWTRESFTGDITRVWGGSGARAAAERDWAQSAHRGDPGSVQRARGGRFASELGGARAPDPALADLDTTTRDPQKLLAVLVRASGLRDASAGERALDTATELLRTGTVPADLQSAIYRALGRLPDLRVSRDVTLQGRTGTALGPIPSDGRDTTEIVVDDSTGAYLGERTIQHADYASVPAGTVTYLASVTTRQVDVVDPSSR